MGLLKFRLPPLDARRLERLKRAYVVGPDRSPFPMQVEFRGDLLVCKREATESGRLHVPWAVPGHGEPVLGTSTLAERPEPYHLALELARGRLCEVRDQLGDWSQLGLVVTGDLQELLARAQSAFSRAATRRDRRDEMNAAASECLAATLQAGRRLIDLYVGQVLRTRLAGGPSQLPTSLACVIDCDSKGRVPVSLEAFNAARIRCHWKLLEPDEGQPLWDRVDSQLASARRNGMTIHAGPLIDLREEMLPDWLTLRRDDFDTILSMSVDFVKSVLMHYRGRIPVWTLVHRAGCSDAMGLSEEDQIRLTARLLQVARQTDPGAQFLVGFDRPWAEWMTAGRFQLGPLHLADYLARSDLGLSGIELEIAPGFGRPGSLYRDVFDFSKLLDLFALVNLPIAVNLAIPSNSGSDPQAAPGIVVEAAEWPEPPGEASQLQIASAWISLAVAKPFVRSVTWSTLTDDHAHLYPFSGLHHDSTRPKQLAAWLADFRRRLLA